MDPKRKVGIGLGRSYGCQRRRCVSLEPEECTLLRVCEVYEFCLTLRAPRSEKSAERPSEGGFEGIEKVFAALGFGGGAQLPPARKGMLSQDLFESPNGAQSHRSSAANG